MKCSTPGTDRIVWKNDTIDWEVLQQSAVDELFSKLIGQFMFWVIPETSLED
jgi:hypothetical protein